MTACILLSGLIRRPIRSAPCRGTIIRYPDQIWRGQIIGRCGCVTRFEAERHKSEFGLFYRLFWLAGSAQQAQQAQSLDLTRVQWVHSRDARRGGACGNTNAVETKTKRRSRMRNGARTQKVGNRDWSYFLTWRAGLQALFRGGRLCASFFRRGFLKGESP